MRSSRALVVGLGALVVASAVPDVTPAVDGAIAQVPGAGASSRVAPAGNPLQRAATSCTAQPAPHPVRRPQFVRRIATGETGWFSSPSLVDLDGDGRKEIVAPFYSTFVFDAKGRRLGQGRATGGRVYAPSVVTDFEGDVVPDIVVGGSGPVPSSAVPHGRCHLQRGWPESTIRGGQTSQIRGL